MGAALCGQRSGAQHLDSFAALTAAAWRRRSAAEGSLSRSRVARYSLLYGIVLIYSRMSLVTGSLAITLQARHCPALHRRGIFIRSRNPCQA